MNVVVCIKQVPATTKVRVDQQTNAVSWDGESIINPFDMYALEEAIRIKEQHGGKVTVISMGPSQAGESLREAIALGADEVILLSDPAFDGSDTLATSYILSKAIARLGEFDIVICGKQTMDGDTGQVAPQLAEWLGIPFASYVSKIEETKEEHIQLQRMVDEGYRVVEIPLPVAITVVKEINVPRLPPLRGLMMSKKAQIPVWNAEEVGVDIDKVGSSGSPTKIIKYSYPEKVSGGEILQGDPESQVDQLVEKLQKII